MTFRGASFLALLGAAIPLCANAAQAQAPTAAASSAAFNIPAGALAPALQLFARQAGVDVIFSASQVQGLRTVGVSGRLAPREALDRLLSGTSLQVVQDSSGAFLVRTSGPFGPGADTHAASGVAAETAEILVTGTRIRGVDVPAPTITVTREDLGKTGFSTLEEVFESLPQNFDEVTPEGRFANEGGSQLRGLNNTRVTAVDLRGLGAQSTLTLVNGTRRAGSIGGRVVDISAIPLSIIERVEVVAGGRSAIYGADAVAGVVNLVTRRSFDGAESQTYFGTAEKGGGERLQLGQIVGGEFDRGGIVAAYDFGRDWKLDLADVGLLSLTPNPEIGLTQLSLNAQADTWRHSAYLAGRFELTERIELHADGLYTHKRFEDLTLRVFEGAAQNSVTDTSNKAEHYSLSGGAHVDLGGDWSFNVSGSTSAVDNTADSSIFIDLGFFSFSQDAREKAKATVSTVSAVADGPLFSIGGLVPRAAVGVEWRREGFRSVLDREETFDDDRTIRSAFAELVVPLTDDGAPGLRRLEVSLAGRYDDYSDFGGTFNPQAGVVWEPVMGLTLRGAYSTAFRAPALVELESSVDIFLEVASDPTRGGAFVPVLFAQGENPDLQPEEAESWSIGLDYEPAFAPWAKVSLSYFDVAYDGRIEQPSVNADRELVLERADRFPGLIGRSPTPAQAAAFLGMDADDFIDNDTGTPFDPATQNILDVFPDLVLFDNRTGNIAVERVKALDLAIDSEFETELGALSLGVNLTHTLKHDRKVTPTSPAFSLLNEVGKPVDTRVRATAGWSRGAFGAYAYVNYVDGYANPFSRPPSRMDSWTTVDLTLRFDSADIVDGGLLDNLSAALSITNLFDNDPPLFPDSLQGVLYDSTNASPFGRFISLRLVKRW